MVGAGIGLPRGRQAPAVMATLEREAGRRILVHLDAARIFSRAAQVCRTRCQPLTLVLRLQRHPRQRRRLQWHKLERTDGSLAIDATRVVRQVEQEAPRAVPRVHA
eukprot:6116752-Prymnesium_polylepis.1